jgi:hypothetical protein
MHDDDAITTDIASLLTCLWIDIFFTVAEQPPVGQGHFIIEDSWSHSDTPHSVGLLWTSDQPDAETPTWQHTPLTTDIYIPGAIRTHNPNKRAAADPRLRPRGHWDRQLTFYKPLCCNVYFCLIKHLAFEAYGGMVV